MENTAMRDSLTRWFKEKKLNLTDLVCLAYASRTTVQRILAGKKHLATQYRCYLVTGLEEFKLSSEQVAEYQKSYKKKGADYWDQRIAEHFTKVWNETNNLPDLEYKLMTTQSKYQNRKELTEKIKKELLLGSETAQPNESLPVPDTRLKVVSLDELPLVIEPHELYAFSQRLERMLKSGTAEEITQFAKKNKNLLSYMYGQLVIFIDPKPFNAASVMRQKKELLKR